MTLMKAQYLGGLRVECEHTASGTKIITDAPKDNHGKGESFSPTDLCATALGVCILITMGIYADLHGLDVTGASAEITKTMGSDPRRISLIEVIITMPDKGYSDKDKKILERVANTCPVHASLSEQMEQRIVFRW